MTDLSQVDPQDIQTALSMSASPAPTQPSQLTPESIGLDTSSPGLDDVDPQDIQAALKMSAPPKQLKPPTLSPTTHPNFNKPKTDLSQIDPQDIQTALKMSAPKPSPVQQFNNMLGPVVSPQAHQAAAETYGQPVDIVRDIDAGVSGALGLVDATANFQPQWIQAMSGIPAQKRLKLDTRGLYNSQPDIQRERAQAPARFDQIAGIAPFVVATPQAAFTKSAIVNTMLNAGGANTLMYTGKQAQEGKDANAPGAVSSFAEGALGGAAAHIGLIGGIEAAKATARAVGNARSSIARQILKQFLKTPQGQATGIVTEKPLDVETFMKNLNIDKSSPSQAENVEFIDFMNNEKRTKQGGPAPKPDESPGNTTGSVETQEAAPERIPDGAQPQGKKIQANPTSKVQTFQSNREAVRTAPAEIVQGPQADESQLMVQKLESLNAQLEGIANAKMPDHTEAALNVWQEGLGTPVSTKPKTKREKQNITDFVRSLQDRADQTWATASDAMANGKVKALAVAAISGALSTTKAEAANAATRLATDHASLLQSWLSVPIPEAALGIAVTKYGLHPLAKALMADDGALAKIGIIWKDTLDHVAFSDKLAQKLFQPSSQLNVFGQQAAPVNLTKEIWQTTGQVQQASMGIRFDEHLKQLGMQELRSGKVKPADFIRGNSAASAQMTQEQRNVLAMWKIGRDHLLALVEERITLLEDFKTANPDLGRWSVERQALDSLNFVKESISGVKGGASAPNELLAQGVSNWMDGLFFWNPEFHGTNFFDQLISAAPYVGTKNMISANKIILTNPKIRKVLWNSNLQGGLKVDRIEANIAAGKTKATLADKDIPSDLVNANSTFIGGTLKYFANNEKQLAKLGYTGSAEQFTEDLLAGKLDPTVSMDVYTHNAEILSRVMGVDPYRLNTNFVGMGPLWKALALFCKQPARVSRLAMHYLATGNFTAFYMMMGYTMLVGGRAALPEDFKGVMGLTSAEEAYKMSSTAQSFDLYQKLTGQTQAPKLTWAFLWFLSFGSNPLASSKEQTGKSFDKLFKGDFVGAAKGISSLAPAVAPRIGIGKFQLPTGEVERIGKAVIEAYQGERNISARGLGGVPIGSDTVSLDTPYLQARHILDPFIPGKDVVGDTFNEAQNEEWARQNDIMAQLFGDNGLMSNGYEPKDYDQQYYNESGGNWQQHGYDQPEDLLGNWMKGKSK